MGSGRIKENTDILQREIERIMKIYVGKNKLRAKQINQVELIEMLLDRAGIPNEYGEFGDNSQSWIQIEGQNKKPARVHINILFNRDGEFEGFSIHEARIITIIDEENERQVVRV